MSVVLGALHVGVALRGQKLPPPLLRRLPLAAVVRVALPLVTQAGAVVAQVALAEGAQA